MQSEKKKSREDTWTTEELKKHVMASIPDAYREDKRLEERRHRREEGSSIKKESRPRNKEREPEKERREEKEVHRSTDHDNERRRERHKEKEKDRLRERDGTKDRDREKVRDRDREKGHEKERHHRTEKENEKESDRKARHKDARAELEDNAKTYGSKEEEELRRREAREERKRAEDRERRHRERNEKEGSSRENSGRKDKHERSLEYKDEKRERRHRMTAEQEPTLLGKERERRHRERSEHGNTERDKKQRHRSSDTQERDGEKKHRASKDGSLDLVDKNFEDKITERRRGDRTSLEAGGERWQRENRQRDQREENGSSKDNNEEMKHHNRAKIKGLDVDVGDQVTRASLGDHRNSKERKARQREEIEKEEIVDRPLSHDTVYEGSPTNYKEDFETYDDDFEDDDDGDEEPELKPEEMSPSRVAEIAEIQRAINAENDMISSIPSTLWQKEYEREQVKESTNLEKKQSHRGVFIDFISAKQRQVSQKMANKLKKRSTEILRLVDMDFSITFSLLDLSPVNEYERYIRSFGKTNTKQAYVQCNEDYVDRDIQTEQVETEEKWTQHPGEGATVSGGCTDTDAEFADAVSLLKVDSRRLTNFLRSACQVVAVLLEEDHAERQSSWNVKSQDSSLSISEGSFQLNMNLPFLQDRKVCCLHFSQVQRHVLLSVHGLPANPGVIRLDDQYIICVWNIWEPSTPLKILVCESEVKCCCFSPGKATLVFAGTIDGTVAVWDLREDSSLHHSMKFTDGNWVFRSSTFSTDGILTLVNHKCSVQAIEPISTTVIKERNPGIAAFSSEEETSGLSFQIASLDENGYLNLWVVVELQKVDPAGSQSDLGLIPGGKVKLVHSSTIYFSDSFFSKDLSCLGIPQTLNIKFLPSDSNHFIIGTDIGLVCHGARHGTRVPPKLYKLQQHGTRPTKVTTMDFSPFGEPIFLVGCSDGSLRLHTMSDEYPILQWNNSTNGQPVVALHWSLTKPSVFFVLDATSSIYIWDLLESDLQPVAKDTVRSDKVITMAVLGEPEKNNGLSGLALAKKSGTLDIQYIKKKWATAGPEEPQKLHLLLHKAL